MCSNSITLSDDMGGKNKANGQNECNVKEWWDKTTQQSLGFATCNDSTMSRSHHIAECNVPSSKRVMLTTLCTQRML